MLEQKALLGEKKIPREGPWLSLALWTVSLALLGVCRSMYLSVCLERGWCRVSFGVWPWNSAVDS